MDARVTFFVGENGAGKSTLLEAIADQIGFNPAGGSTQNYKAYEVDQSESALGDYVKLSWWPKVTNGFFCVPRHFISLRRIWMKPMRTATKHTGENRFIISHTGNLFLAVPAPVYRAGHLFAG